MYVIAFVGGPLQTVGYLVHGGLGSQALIVDAPLGCTSRMAHAISLNKLEALFLVDTHGHWDHAADNAALVRECGVQLCAHVWDETRLAHPDLATEGERALPVAPSHASVHLDDGQVLQVGDYTFEVLHTPGHTPGSICLLERRAGVLFTGDTLLRLAIGRTDFPGGNAQQLTQSLARLASLPDTVRVYPGHGMATTIGAERWLIDLALASIEK